MLALANVKTEYGGNNKHDFHQQHAAVAAAQYQQNFYNTQVILG